MIWSIILFFVMTWSFGHTVTFFIKRKKSGYEQFFMNIGIGMGTIPILGVILNLLNIPLYWPVFLVLGLIMPAYSFYMYGFRIPKIKFAVKKSSVYFLVVLLMAIMFFGVYLTGAFKYPYLEDDDPWLHTVSTTYVSEFRTFSSPASIDMNAYDEPYPQGFTIIMALMYQATGNIIWTLKFFNVLILALGIIFFYFMAASLLDDKKKALFAAFIITVIPCFMSHFIWASTLSITLFFPALYAVKRMEDDKGWMLVSILVIASILVTQPSNAFIFGVLLGIYWLVKCIVYKKLDWRILTACVIALVVAIGFFWMPMLMKYGLEDTAGANSIKIHNFAESINTLSSGGAEVYTFNDFMVSKTVSKMDNPIGIGFVLFWLSIVSFLMVLYALFRKKNDLSSPLKVSLITFIIWALISVIGINGNRLPFSMLMPHRWWAIMCIPLALLVGYMFFDIGEFFDRFKIKGLVYLLLVVGILITSGFPKYVVETSYWPPGVNWGAMEEVTGYMQNIPQLPEGTKIFPMCSSEFKVIAFDRIAEPWDADYIAFKKTVFNMSLRNIHSWLKLEGYKYMTLDAYCVRTYGLNETNALLMEFSETSYFSYAGGNKAFFLFRVT